MDGGADDGRWSRRWTMDDGQDQKHKDLKIDDPPVGGHVDDGGADDGRWTMDDGRWTKE